VPFTETVEIRGHLLDTGVLSRCLDDVRSLGGDYVIERFDVGKDHDDESYARIRVDADGRDHLASLLMRLNAHGVNLADPGEVVLRAAEQDGVFPFDFYSTTNLETQVRLDGHWVDVRQPEMDCGLLVEGEPGSRTARTIPVSEIRAGDEVVCGAGGVRVLQFPSELTEGGQTFEFMNSEVSSEKPQALLVRQIAQEMRDVKAAGKKVLWVAGPAVVHTGAAPAMVALVESGFVDVLFGGNAIATHDIESSLYGTSLGIDLSQGRGVEHGHEHHIRAINRVRAAGSIADAVEQGVLTSGVMHALVTHGKQFVLVGSVRDDGPLPDVHTDVIAGQAAMRRALDGVGFAIMVATMLHSVATGNLLPASIPLVCVDINPATVTKLADRGSSQARGVVTDVGLFLEQLATELGQGWRERRDSARSAT
jgi:lysine-ketoglutarate reductase/saccharopine dehydrogenase-like protein (TIGR00300 family)